MTEKKQNIFDKLTDPKQYTGAHKERFDKDGKGKGLAGRVDNTGPKDLKNMVDSKTGSTTLSNNNTNTGISNSTKVTPSVNVNKSDKVLSKVDDTKKSETKKPNIFDKLTDPNQYTGAHKERFDKDGKGKGLAGRTDNNGPKDLKNMVNKK